MKYNAKYAEFLAELGKKTGQTAVCEAAHAAYKACCEAEYRTHGTTITLADKPNYSVELSMGGIDTPIKFQVDAYDESDALEVVADELKDHNMEGYFETDEPEYPEDYIELSKGWIRSDHVVVHKIDGSDTWAGMVPNFMLSYFVNADASGLSDEEEAEVKAFEQELYDDGVDVTSVYPVDGPDGNVWKEVKDNYREPDSVLCTARRRV